MSLWINFPASLPQRTKLEELDIQQNKTKNLRPRGPAIVRGVAGSGKSLVLKKRVEILAENFTSILVLSYNRFMNGWLKSKLTDLQVKVECKTFNQWAYQQFKYNYNSEPKKFLSIAKQCRRKYEAILIDEAQDFHDEWFIALNQYALDQDTQALFIVYDNTQSVYGQSQRRKSDWSWKKLNINIPGGRSQILDLNYRNSPEILELAWHFIEPVLLETEMKVERRERDETNKIIKTPSIGSIIEPQKKLSRSSGIKPLLLEVYYEDMPSKIAYQVQEALNTHPESSIGILLCPYHRGSKYLQQEISKELKLLGISHHAPEVSKARDSNVVNRPYVIIDSWNALKGVEFDAVIIAGVDSLEVQEKDKEKIFRAKAGLYTAMTRARDHLILLYENKTSMVEALEYSLNQPDSLIGQA